MATNKKIKAIKAKAVMYISLLINFFAVFSVLFVFPVTFICLSFAFAFLDLSLLSVLNWHWSARMLTCLWLLVSVAVSAKTIKDNFDK